MLKLIIRRCLNYLNIVHKVETPVHKVQTHPGSNTISSKYNKLLFDYWQTNPQFFTLRSQKTGQELFGCSSMG